MLTCLETIYKELERQQMKLRRLAFDNEQNEYLDRASGELGKAIHSLWVLRDLKAGDITQSDISEWIEENRRSGVKRVR